MGNVFLALLVMPIAWVIGVVAGANATKRIFEKQAIDRGYAEYCPKTGDWAWKDECDE